METHAMLMDRKNAVKMTILSKAICRFNVIPSTIPTAFFNELEQIILNFIYTPKEPPRTQNSQSNPEKEE